MSVRKLTALEPATGAPGHRKPLAGAEVVQALHKLAADFERIAFPEHVKSGSPGWRYKALVAGRPHLNNSSEMGGVTRKRGDHHV